MSDRGAEAAFLFFIYLTGRLQRMRRPGFYQNRENMMFNVTARNPLLLSALAGALLFSQAGQAATSSSASSGDATPAAVMPAAPDGSPSTFTSSQREDIGQIAATYLAQHPEYLVAASESLKQQREAAAKQAVVEKVISRQNDLSGDKLTPSVGPADAKVVVVEFSDYQCSFCNAMSPVMDKVMKASPQVRFVFKEFPIFGQHWPVSEQAAETGVAVMKAGGAQAYQLYRDAVYGTGHNEGKLTPADIAAAVKKAGVKTAVSDDTVRQQVKDTLALGQALGLSGTPAFVVMPAAGASVTNTTVFTGATTLQQLQQAITLAGSRG